MRRKWKGGDWLTPAEEDAIGEKVMNALFGCFKWLAIIIGSIILFTILLIPIGIPFLLIKHKKTKAAIVYILVLLTLAGIYYLLGTPGKS